jgi:soluble lytic murein transglycosylase-like protein
MTMTQRFVIHLLPVEVLLVSCLAGSLIFADARWADAASRAAAGAVAGSSLPGLFTPEVQYWGGKITTWAADYQLDPALVATVMQIESCGNPRAVSPSGAQGLFQVMPDHFAAGDDMLDPDTNAQRGLAYLALGLARSGGNTGLAMAGYNGGLSMLGLASTLWPPETKSYWYWGSGIYADAAGGQAGSPRLQAWLQAGGASLCARAAQTLGLGR